MKKKLTALVLALAAAATLTACSTTIEQTTPENLAVAKPFRVTLTDGRTIECIYLRDTGNRNSASGGPSCDWNNAR